MPRLVRKSTKSCCHARMCTSAVGVTTPSRSNSAASYWSQLTSATGDSLERSGEARGQVRVGWVRILTRGRVGSGGIATMALPQDLLAPVKRRVGKFLLERTMRDGIDLRKLRFLPDSFTLPI